MVDLQELFVIVTGELAAQIVQKEHMYQGQGTLVVLTAMWGDMLLGLEMLNVQIVLQEHLLLQQELRPVLHVLQVSLHLELETLAAMFVL